MYETNKNTNEENNDGCCPECQCKEAIQGPTHYECAECGIQISIISYDNEYKYDSEMKGPRIANTKSSIGSDIGIPERGEKFPRRLINIHRNLSRRRPKYWETISKELKEIGEPDTIINEISEIIQKANENLKLSRNRYVMDGKPELEGDVPEYRRRVFAVAALAILQRRGSENRSQQIADEWNIHRNDLSEAVKLIERNLSPPNNELYYSEQNCSHLTRQEVAFNNRKNQLNQHLATIRDLLASKCGVGGSDARAIVKKARELLINHGEPIEYWQEWNDGKYCNWLSDRAALTATVHAMIEMGISKDTAKELYASFPVRSMKTFFDRIAREYREYCAEA
jgi:transcription initiation factor TFIIIB Brf1 subunit/transcription initiation factor TFIIB